MWLWHSGEKYYLYSSEVWNLAFSAKVERFIIDRGKDEYHDLYAVFSVGIQVT